MRKRSYTKVVALVSIVAILSLTAPGLFAGETYRSFFTFKRFVETPLHFLYSFLYFTPLYDAGKVLPPAIDNNDANPVKVLGLIDSVRPADDD